jgi:hypothetical protein
MKRRIAALLMVMGFMLATAGPVFAVPEGCPGGEMQPGQDEHDTSDDAAGRGEMCGGQI